MTDFLMSSACRGRMPKNLGTLSRFPRGDLLAKIIRKRNAVRFLVAPSLFGKTVLAAEYADSVFSFERVFWIPGKSPCFLRDLDRRAIVPALVKKGEKPALAVFKDLPLLDDGRADALSAVFDELLAQGCEVMATMTPRCDVFQDRQADGIRIKTSEFLLTDTEIDAKRGDLERFQRPAVSFSAAERIPGLFWGTVDARERFCQAIVKEELAIDELLAVFVMLVLEHGCLSDITAFVRGWNAGLLEGLQADYAYLGIDPYREEFSAAAFTLDNLVKAFMPSLDAMATHSSLGEKSALVCRLASQLVASGNPGRACELVLRMCPPRQRATWLEASSGQLLQQGCFLPAHRVYESIKTSSVSQGGLLAATEAWRLAFLSDAEKALKCIKRLYLAVDTDSETQALAALLMFRFGNKHQAKKALAALNDLVRFKAMPLEGWVDPATARDLVAEGSSWKMLVVGQLCLVQGKGAATELVEALRLAGARHEHFAFVLVWLLDDIHAAIEAGMGDEEKRQSALSAHYVAAYLEQRGHEAERGFFDALLIAKLERVFTALNDAEGAAPIPRSLVTFAHETEVSLFGQRSAYQRLQQEVEARKSEFRRTHPNAMRADAAADRSQERATPTLNVRLFGGLEVRVGEVIVDPRLFSRQKVKVLLALLVINQGRELPRERLCKMLWPHSDLTASQRNLYSLWAMLKQALSSVTGSCPYLIHTQFSYKLDGHIASSDVAEFDSLCKKLLFSFPQADEWAQAFMQIDDLYIDDLLPTEVENPSIEQARTDYRNRLVDTLSAAAVRLLDAGEFQASLWFARAAILRDATREDSYLTLMRAQVALGQRAAALDTYFKCRHYLVEELGIDPSDRAVSLYSSIIAEEPGLRSYEPSTSKK